MPPHDFEPSLAWLRADATTLPFEVGAATQRGRMKTMNNQDASAIVTQRGTIVAVVCDGCGSSDPDLGNNEVGARLTSILVAEEVSARLDAAPADSIEEDLPGIESRVLERLRQIAVSIAGSGSADMFVRNHLFTTILAVAIDRHETVIFGCGDGMYAVNGTTTILPENRLYLAEQLLGRTDGPHLQVHRRLRMRDTKSALIATDGMQDLWDRYAKKLNDYWGPSSRRGAGGFEADLLLEFNKSIWFAPDVADWAATGDGHDDRSFIMVRRIKPDRHRRTTHVED